MKTYYVLEKKGSLNLLQVSLSTPFSKFNKYGLGINDNDVEASKLIIKHSGDIEYNFHVVLVNKFGKTFRFIKVYDKYNNFIDMFFLSERNVYFKKAFRVIKRYLRS